jgi:uncharacterized membrane protein YphA (DoxX/SURF4 family)
MKYIALFARILVGLEFVFSGFVKVVDPYGTGLKLQEYFEVFAEDIPGLAPFFHMLADNAQPLSLVFCSVELILGVALLFSFRMKITAWVVLLFMTFFTFLTFYSAYFNKVTDCGCFGDFLKLKPWDSFTKDVVSMVFILIIFFYRKNYSNGEIGTPMVLISTIIAFGIGIYGLRNLPLVDFLPYAVGKSIPEQMKKPDIKPVISYVFEDKTANANIKSEEYLMDTLKYKYVSSEILNEKDLIPKISDFSLADTSGLDVTAEAFEGNKFLLIIKNGKGLEDLDFTAIKSLLNKNYKKKVNPMVLSSLPTSELDKILKEKNIRFQTYSCDEKVLKTMARANPCLILLKDGIVMGKWTINNIPSKDAVQELLNN